MKTESIPNPIVYFTDKRTEVFHHYYNPLLDVFGTKDDWICKDNYECIIADAALYAQEFDVLFNNHYNEA